MSTRRIRIVASVHERERAGMELAASLLREVLARAVGGSAGVEVEIVHSAPGTQAAHDVRGAVAVLSLLPELDRAHEPIADTGLRWAADVRRLLSAGACVYVRNIFRHVSDRARDGRPDPVLQRIRRLDRMAVELSRETGIAVVDIDRAFADAGARQVQTDYRLGGAQADKLSAHATVHCLLSFGLDELVDPDVQEKARALLNPRIPSR